jgi:hypothetical protein
MAEKEPKNGEFWWAWPPDGDYQPVQIFMVKPSGNHVLTVLGRHEPAYAKQWTLVRPIIGWRQHTQR